MPRPNVYDRTSVNNDDSVEVDTNGVVVPYWAVGFEKPFENPPQVVFEDDRIVEVNGDSEEAVILRDMLVGGRLIELAAVSIRKRPATRYPAGSNSVGALHFGIDLAKPNDYIRRMMPEWEEPPVHMDLISFDSTVMAGNTTLIDEGFLKALDAPVSSKWHRNSAIRWTCCRTGRIKIGANYPRATVRCSDTPPITNAIPMRSEADGI